jgi:hypothetical protein
VRRRVRVGHVHGTPRLREDRTGAIVDAPAEWIGSMIRFELKEENQL